MKKIFVLFLAAVMLFSLSACGVSSSTTTTTTFSTSKTDSDGNTTTKTVTNEMGVSAGTDGIHTTNETTTNKSTTPPSGSMAEMFPPKEEWYDLYTAGGEGENEDGDMFYFAYNDPDDVTEAILLIVFSDGGVFVRNGEVTWNEEDECYELYDADVDTSVPFVFLEHEDDNVFGIRFLANDVEVFFDMVDQDTIINDIYGTLANSTPGSEAEEAEEVEETEAA